MQTALLYTLFLESSILPPESAIEKTELLGEASSAIVSSLAETKPDIASQLAIRLLLPYTTQPGNGPVLATINGVLERYSPSTPEYARTLLSLCRPLVERKSVLVFEGCVAVMLRLYQQQLALENFERATTVLLDGMELEAVVLGEAALGACHRTLVGVCNNTALSLLQFAVGGVELVGPVHKTAQFMVDAFEKHSTSPETIPAAMLLNRALSIVAALLEEDFESTAKHTIESLCLSRDGSSGHTIIRTLVSMHWVLLKLACLVLEQDGLDLNGADSFPFDQQGVTLLMETLARLEASWACGLAAAPSDEEILATKSLLAKGLAKAFVLENARKKKRLSRLPGYRDDIAGILTTDLYKHDRATQERVVSSLLDY